MLQIKQSEGNATRMPGIVMNRHAEGNRFSAVRQVDSVSAYGKLSSFNGGFEEGLEACFRHFRNRLALASDSSLYVEEADVEIVRGSGEDIPQEFIAQVLQVIPPDGRAACHRGEDLALAFQQLPLVRDDETGDRLDLRFAIV
ncbi:hypothetical protein [Noviherbaspirillum galbum]|uniref:Uncharacterized protein n=1 Tax=Noviherbaspirillum galbum TaxID=2709383 RepID=A0A6B3SSK0_9BURK|nr:hypothetical protein [Noviherbaspirillum galbum]